MSTAALRSLQSEEESIMAEIASLEAREDEGALLRLVALRADHLSVREAILEIERGLENHGRGPFLGRKI